MLINQLQLHTRFNVIKFLFILIFATLSVTTKAEVFSQFQKVGNGSMSWMFIDIYDASLFTKSGRYKAGVYPQVLNITYLKNIDKKRLISATKEQWELQTFSDENIKSWLKELESIWPNINSGDSLTFYVAENKRGDFYHNDSWLGGIDNPKFSEAFLSIWLSEKTSQPRLREQLLGL